MFDGHWYFGKRNRNKSFHIMLVRFRMRSALGSDSRCIFLWIWREKNDFVTLSQKCDTYKKQWEAFLMYFCSRMTERLKE